MTERAGRRRRLKRRVTLAVAEDGGSNLFSLRGRGQERAAKRGFDKSKCVPLEVCADREVARGIVD